MLLFQCGKRYNMFDSVKSLRQVQPGISNFCSLFSLFSAHRCENGDGMFHSSPTTKTDLIKNLFCIQKGLKRPRVSSETLLYLRFSQANRNFLPPLDLLFNKIYGERFVINMAQCNRCKRLWTSNIQICIFVSPRVNISETRLSRSLPHPPHMFASAHISSSEENLHRAKAGPYRILTKHP